jgi:CspA family cold shock protein
MATGRISTIRADKGFGFITQAPGPAGTGDLFFHRSAVADAGFDDLREGQDVSFEAGPDPRDPSRLRATDVRAVAAEGP